MLQIIIDAEAKILFIKPIGNIKKDSLQNAEKVRNKILVAIKEMAKNPERHGPDKYRIGNDGSPGF